MRPPPDPEPPSGGIAGIVLAAALIVAAVQLGPWVWAQVIEPLIASLAG